MLGLKHKVENQVGCFRMHSPFDMNHSITVHAWGEIQASCDWSSPVIFPGSPEGQETRPAGMDDFSYSRRPGLTSLQANVKQDISQVRLGKRVI